MAILLKPLEDGMAVLSPVLRQRARDSTKKSFTHHYIAFWNNREAAFVSIDVRPSVDFLVLYELIVEPSLRQKGIGTDIVAEVERFALQAGRRRIVLDPEPFMGDIDGEVLVKWYRKLGFHLRPGTNKEMEKEVI